MHSIAVIICYINLCSVCPETLCRSYLFPSKLLLLQHIAQAIIFQNIAVAMWQHKKLIFLFYNNLTVKSEIFSLKNVRLYRVCFHIILINPPALPYQYPEAVTAIYQMIIIWMALKRRFSGNTDYFIYFVRAFVHPYQLIAVKLDKPDILFFYAKCNG